MHVRHDRFYSTPPRKKKNDKAMKKSQRYRYVLSIPLRSTTHTNTNDNTFSTAVCGSKLLIINWSTDNIYKYNQIFFTFHDVIKMSKIILGKILVGFNFKNVCNN